MKITLLDAKTLGDDLSFDILSSFGEVVVFDNTTPEEVENHVSDSDVLVVNKIKLGAQNLSRAYNLKLICIAATGYDNVDLEYCKENKIAVCNVVGYSTHSVAQVTLSMALSLATHIPEYTDFVNSGKYTESKTANRLVPVYHELYGKTWGVIGLGNIGKQVARVAESMGCKVIAFKKTPDSLYDCRSLEYIFKNADIISVHLPLSSETRGIIDEKLIFSMKENAIFINVARGAVCDENALAEAIKQNKIAGLGIDVYSYEPFDEKHPYNSLLGMPNVCLTPHMAWGAYESRKRCLDEIAQNIQSFLDGDFKNRLV